MRKRILSILLCVCMALSLLPTAALAAANNYDGWAAATAQGVTLTADMDTVTIDGVAYTYKGEADTSGVDLAPYNSGDGSAMALKEACCWKAKDGYVLYKPTVESVAWYGVDLTTSAEVTLHDAQISTASACALKLPVNSPSSTAYPVPVTVHVEGTNSLTTNNYSYSALYHELGDTTFTGTGDGTLSLTNSAASAYTLHNQGGAVTIEAGAQVTVNGGNNNYIGGNLTVTGSGSKLTIADGANLAIGVWGGTPAATVTVKNGGVLENNGTLSMYELVDASNPHIVGEISGSGAFQFGSSSQLYCLVDGEFIAYGGDVETSGLNLSGKDASGNADATYNAPTIQTCYRAGSGYIIFTPATADPVANAKLELHGATINTTSGRALYLPAEAVDITVTDDNSLTANGSYNYAIDTNEQAVNITGGGNLTLTGNKGIASWYGSTPSVAINIGGNLVISTNQTYSISANGNVNLSAASITTGIITAGSRSLTATAKTGNLTIDNGTSSSMAVYADDITLNAPNGAISVAGAGSSLLQSSGMVTLNAKGNIAFTSSDTSSTPIHFGTGVSMTSDAGSIDVTTSGYSGITKTDGGAGGGGVTLNAAKDITLNADSTAISTSAEAVYLTAGGKLTSTSKYGFQVGELTIKANEVSIEGTQQDGIRATSVAITNPTGGNCKSVSVTATSGSDSCAAIRALGSAETGNITIKADELFLCGNDSAKAISALGTVTIGDAGMILGAISAGTDSIDSRIICAANGGDKSDGLNLSTPPSVATYYTANSGYVLFTPATATAPAKLTLHNATIYNTTATNDETGTGIALPDGAVTLAVEGINTISAQATNAISGSNTDVTLSGTGVLNVGYKGIALKSTAANPHSFTKGANVTLNGIVNTYDNS
ncbi:MAG: hypothetical protein VB071_02565, partial [Lawsonibacter sp.]|nr:hypothetical protein [Lawsonibacter sp.]